MVLRPALILYNFLICAVKAWALMKQSCRTILNKARSWRGVVFRGDLMDLPGTKAPVAACIQMMQLMVTRVRPKQPAIALCRMPSRANASTSCLTPIGVEWVIIRTISENWGKTCNCWFELVTLRRQIWGSSHISYDFGLRPSHLALKWKSGQSKVGFHWVAVTGTFHVNFSTLKAQKFDAYRLYILKLGCNNLFYKCILDHVGVVSLTFRELSKKFSRNFCIAEIVLLLRISSWNFVRVPKAILLGTCMMFQLEILTINVISGIV